MNQRRATTGAMSDERCHRRSRRSSVQCDRLTSGAIDDRDRAARRSTSGARPTIAPRDLIDRAARSTIAPRDLVDCAARRRGAIVGAAARSGLSLLSLSLSENEGRN